MFGLDYKDLQERIKFKIGETNISADEKRALLALSLGLNKVEYMELQEDLKRVQKDLRENSEAERVDNEIQQSAVYGTKIRQIGEVETEGYSLTVYECSCGFHIGLDTTYMDQVDGVVIKCPSCTNEIDTDYVDEIEWNNRFGC
jgi:hypothetical protein